MIYKGLMGEEEVSKLFNSFDKIYRFYLRSEGLHLINTKEKLAEVDIEAEIYNKIVNTTIKDDEILVLTSNSIGSIVTNFIIYQSIGVRQILEEKLKEQKFSYLIQANSIIVISGIKMSTESLTSRVSATEYNVRSFVPRSRINNLETPEQTLRIIEHKLKFGGNFNLSSLKRLDTEVNTCANLQSLGLNPVLVIELREDYVKPIVFINTGYSKNQLSKKFSITPELIRGFNLKPIFKLTERFEVPNFDKLVDPDAQSFLLKKVKGYVNRRVSQHREINLSFGTIADIYPGQSIDKNFFKPTSRVLNNALVRKIENRDVEYIKSELSMLENTLKLSNPRIELRLGDAIEISIKQYQEIWGSYKPLSRTFFTGNQVNLSRVRELFYNVLYAYVDRALGGYISSSGKRKYTPKISSEVDYADEEFEKMLKQFPTLTEDEERLIQYINRADDPFSNDKVSRDYSSFIKEFMEDKADKVYASDDYAINFLSKNKDSGFNTILRDSGFSFPQKRVDLYMVSILGIDSRNMDNLLRVLQYNYEIDDEDYGATNAIYTVISRNFYQFFIFIDIENQEIKVIRPSLVDSPTQFSINFQDWDIRMDLTNLINNLISKPKDLVTTDKDRVGLSKPANPSERSLSFLRDENLQRAGVVAHPLTLHYDPMRFNKVTRQRSGHLFYENTDGVLVIFPFDTFYHDVEGQREKTADICFTSVPHIYDRMLLKLLYNNLAREFGKWVEDNKDLIKFNVSNESGIYNFAAKISTIASKASPIITPQVFRGIFIKSIQERLEGHIFRNSQSGASACVYVNPLDTEGFFAGGDVGMVFGGRRATGDMFPFEWKMGGSDSVSELDAKIDGSSLRRIKALYKTDTYLDYYESEIEEITQSVNFLSSTIKENIIDVIGDDSPFTYPQVLIELYKVFTADAIRSNKWGEDDKVEEIVRTEIKKYLRENPEAIQVKNVSRRNMSLN